jgi:hypothetical protein
LALPLSDAARNELKRITPANDRTIIPTVSVIILILDFIISVFSIICFCELMPQIYPALTG